MICILRPRQTSAPMLSLCFFSQLITTRILLQFLAEKTVRQIRAVREKKGQTQKHTEEVRNIVPSNAIHNPHAVVVMLRNAHLANATVLTPCRFQKIASTTALTRAVENMIIGI